MGLKKDIKRLTAALANLGDGATEFESRHIELNDLKNTVEKQISRLKKEKQLAEQKNNEYKLFLVENEMLKSDRIVAEQIQQSMLEKRYPAFAEFDSVDLFADMDSAKEIGGDFYDYFKIDDDHICFSIADVEGKGIPAAMYMAVAKTLIRLRLESGEKLSEVLSSVNKQLCLSSMQKRFISMWIGILQVSTGKLTYVNAGHNYPVIKRSNEQAEFVKERSGIPLASYYSKKKPLGPYTEFETFLKKGDTLFMYTDGITEAMNKENELFGEERLLESISIYADSHNMQELSAYLKRCILNFAGRAEQDDDITVLAVKIK